MLVVLTDDGKAMCRKASAAYQVGRKRVLTRIDRKDVAAINTHLDMLLDAFELARPDAE